MHHAAMTPLNAINHFFKIKLESMGDPDIYLGGKLRICFMTNGVECWSLSASKYVQEAIRNVNAQWHEAYPGRKWPRRSVTPFVKNYLPELNVSKELNATETNYYQ